MIACFYNKEDIGETIEFTGTAKIELTERKGGNKELVYRIIPKSEHETKIILPYDKWRLLWADKRGFENGKK